MTVNEAADVLNAISAPDQSQRRALLSEAQPR